MLIIKKAFLKILNLLLPFNNVGDNIYISIRKAVSYTDNSDKAPTLNKYLTTCMLTNKYLQKKYQITSCKYQVKKYLYSLGLEKHVVPTIKLIKEPNELDGYSFPSRCVVKSTAGSGQIILKNSDRVTINKRKIRKWFKSNHYHKTREKNYKYLKNMIIIEPFIFDSDCVFDYKLFYANGVFTATQVDVDRHSDHRRNYYDKAWKKLDFTLKYPQSDIDIKCPKLYSSMISVGEIIAQDFEFVRVDFYTDNKSFYIGEITHVHESGLAKTIPPQLEVDMSKKLLGL